MVTIIQKDNNTISIYSKIQYEALYYDTNIMQSVRFLYLTCWSWFKQMQHLNEKEIATFNLKTKCANIVIWKAHKRTTFLLCALFFYVRYCLFQRNERQVEILQSRNFANGSCSLRNQMCFFCVISCFQLNIPIFNGNTITNDREAVFR